MSNTKPVVVMGSVAPTSVSLALMTSDDGTKSRLTPILQAPGASSLAVLLGIKPEGAEQFLEVLAQPGLGDLMLAQLLEEHSAGTLTADAEAALSIAYGPQPIESSLCNLAEHFDMEKTGNE